MRALAALAAILFLGAVSSAPILHRVDSSDVSEGDGPVLVTVRSQAFTDETSDHFSARFVPDGETGADWEPCTAASSAFCHYAASGNGLRILRFTTIESAGQLEIRYAVGDGPPSEALAIDVGPAPANAPTSDASMAVDGSPLPRKSRRVTLELRIDTAGRAVPTPESEPKPIAQVAPQPKPSEQKRPEQTPEPKMHVAQVPASHPRPSTGPERVLITCSSVPLYADTHGTAIIAAGTVLVARAGDVFLAQRGTVSGRTGALRVLDLGARVYVDAGCVR